MFNDVAQSGPQPVSREKPLENSLCIVGAELFPSQFRWLWVMSNPTNSSFFECFICDTHTHTKWSHDWSVVWLLVQITFVSLWLRCHQSIYDNHWWTNRVTDSGHELPCVFLDVLELCPRVFCWHRQWLSLDLAVLTSKWLMKTQLLHMLPGPTYLIRLDTGIIKETPLSTSHVDGIHRIKIQISHVYYTIWILLILYNPNCCK